MNIELKGEELVLLAEKAIYWASKKALLITDLHLGKTSHLRKNGLPLSLNSQFSTIENLEALIKKLDVDHLYILGDLFHSTLNSEWDSFRNFRSKHLNINFVLIKGNHDIIADQLYTNINIIVYKTLRLEPFILSHEPLIEPNAYNLVGHIHPGIILKGKGRMFNKLPCFYFSEKIGILPAFGTLTGLAKIEIEKNAKVYGIQFPNIIDFTRQTNKSPKTK